MLRSLHVVAELPQFTRDAEAAGLGEQERMAIIESIAADPRQGDSIRESGGLRKVRFGGRGKGKSGGYRVITGYFGLHVPVYLVALLSKRDRGDFSKAEIAGFRKLTTDIARYWRRRST
jgi:hypothetical protein